MVIFVYRFSYNFSLGLLYSFVITPGFLFCFLRTSQEIGWEGHLRNDLLRGVGCKT